MHTDWTYTQLRHVHAGHTHGERTHSGDRHKEETSAHVGHIHGELIRIAGTVTRWRHLHEEYTYTESIDKSGTVRKGRRPHREETHKSRRHTYLQMVPARKVNTRRVHRHGGDIYTKKTYICTVLYKCYTIGTEKVGSEFGGEGC